MAYTAASVVSNRVTPSIGVAVERDQCGKGCLCHPGPDIRFKVRSSLAGPDAISYREPLGTILKNFELNVVGNIDLLGWEHLSVIQSNTL